MLNQHVIIIKWEWIDDRDWFAVRDAIEIAKFIFHYSSHFIYPSFDKFRLHLYRYFVRLYDRKWIYCFIESYTIFYLDLNYHPPLSRFCDNRILDLRIIDLNRHRERAYFNTSFYFIEHIVSIEIRLLLYSYLLGMPYVILAFAFKSSYWT